MSRLWGSTRSQSKSLVENSKCEPELEEPDSQESKVEAVDWEEWVEEGTCSRSVKVSRSARL